MLSIIFQSYLAQEDLGAAFSNYSPSGAVGLNPALIADSKTFLEVNVFGLSFFGTNEHVFHPSEGPGVFRSLFGSSIPLSQSNSSGPRDGYLDFSFRGPGFYLVDGRQSFGMSTNYRAMFNGSGIPEDLAQFFFHGFRHSDLYDEALGVNGAKLNLATWAELGFSYAYMLDVTDDHHINGGVTLKRLFGTGHYGLSVGQMSYVISSEDLMISDFKGEYALAREKLGFGNGWAMDLGFIYRKTIDGRSSYIPFSQKCFCAKSRYRYELGISVLDLGAMTFNDNAAYVKVIEADVQWPDFFETEIQDLEALDAMLQSRVEDDQNITKRSSEGRISMPSAISLQFDYDFNKGFHASAALQEPIKKGGTFDLLRARLLSLIPRYETPLFEAALPLSFYEYEQLRLGLSLRYRYLTMGSSDLLNIALDRDVYGADIFLSLRVPIIDNNACSLRAKRKTKRLIAPCWGD